jgi:ubiquinone/menaquinone biosynthesis C-methylase UbiE
MSTAQETWNERYEKGQSAVTEIGYVGDPIDYTSHPFLWRESIARRLVGSRDGDPNMDLALRHFQPPRKRMLAIGSGLASHEEWFVKCGFVEQAIAFEQSEVAVSKARERIAAEQLGDRLQIICGDVREANYPDESFDVVMVQAAIHHFFEIEEMFRLMHRLLKPGGILIYDEYIGPDHLLFDDKTLDLMDGIDACLDPQYRRSVLMDGEVRQGVPRPTLEQMLEMDPSEGVHASMILPLTYKYFDVLDRRDYGGTFLRPFFTGILQNFNFDDPRDQTIARLIVHIEDVFLAHGLIQHAHSIVVATPRTEIRDLHPSEIARIAYDDWQSEIQS